MRSPIGSLTKDRVTNSDFRLRRFRHHVAPLIARSIAERGFCSIIDVGGVQSYWDNLIEGDRISITLVNPKPDLRAGDARFVSIVGDARDLSRFADDSFDLVHSNSVIEHVGRWPDMRAMAKEVRRLAPAFYVQTPNFWFPLDPHTRTPLIHFLPVNLRHRLHRSFALGWYDRAADLDQAMTSVEDAVMLDATQMQQLFPDATIIRERMLGLTKSLVAVREARLAAIA